LQKHGTIVLLCLLLMLAAMIGALGAQAQSTFETFPLNVKLFHLVNDHQIPAIKSAVARLAPFYWVLPVLALVIIAWRGNRRVILIALVAVAIETVFVHLLKNGFHQPRPGAALPPGTVRLLIPLLTKSFPSGDAAVTFAFASCLRRQTKTWAQVLMYLYAVLIAYERMYVGVHFPLDVVTGAAIGFGSGYVAYFWLGRGKTYEDGTAREQNAENEVASP
jgi:undecaprenyl-diphosphatase